MNIWKSFFIARKNRAALEEMEYNRILTELEEFCAIGERFQYLGITMLCVDYGVGDPDLGWRQGILAQYIDGNGFFKINFFHYDHLPILIKENNIGKSHWKESDGQPLITNESELEVGHLYWIRCRNLSTPPSVARCDQEEGNKYFGNKVWATEAFERWDIVGPIPQPSEFDTYRIWSFEHDAWWKPAGYGYTPNKDEAGVYNYRQAKNICDNANYGGNTFEEMRKV